jgi:hypothetical protein
MAVFSLASSGGDFPGNPGVFKGKRKLQEKLKHKKNKYEFAYEKIV